jgi:hypothetical protein
MVGWGHSKTLDIVFEFYKKNYDYVFLLNVTMAKEFSIKLNQYTKG